MPRFRRRRKIVKWRLQMKLTMTFLGLVVLGLMMQHLLFVKEMTQVAERIPNDGSYVIESVNGVTGRTFLFTILCLVPITLTVGVLTTFKVAGPVYKMEKHLTEIARGNDPGTCRLRKGDELVELCGAINRAVAKLRENSATANLTAPNAEAAAAEPAEAALPSPMELTTDPSQASGPRR